MLNPSSPAFVELLLWTIYVLLTVAGLLTVWSMIRSIRQRGRGEVRSNGIPVGRIAWGVAALLVVTLGVTYALGSTEPLMINKTIYDNAFWLRVSDMLINTSLVLIVIAILGVLIGMSGIQRRSKNS
jgi:putative exporter of polyketide antibiotics